MRYAITIARTFGSGGKETAVKLSELLGIPCYEKEILEKASEYSGINEGLFYQNDEKLKGSYLMNILHSIPRNYTVEPSDPKFIGNNNLFNIQREIMTQLAATESCIIVGKCADTVLQGRTRLLRVFIDAPMDKKKQFVVERMHVSLKEAEKMVRQTDRYRSDYYRYYTGGKKWKDPENYDLMLNTEMMSTDLCAQILKSAVQKMFFSEE